MAKVTYKGGVTGDVYSTGLYDIKIGESLELPDTEARRLLNDFPKCFSVSGLSKEDGKDKAPEGKDDETVKEPSGEDEGGKEETGGKEGKEDEGAGKDDGTPKDSGSLKNVFRKARK